MFLSLRCCLSKLKVRKIRQAFGQGRVRSLDFQLLNILNPSPTPPQGPPGPETNPSKSALPPLKLTLAGKMMLRCFKMPFRGQLDTNMIPT